MPTNPSTGLPEELEKMVLECAAGVQEQALITSEYALEGFDEDKAADEIRARLRDVIDWACKKVCDGCRAGIPVEWFAGHQYVSNFGPVDDVFLHHNEDGYADCAASVLREGLK